VATRKRRAAKKPTPKPQSSVQSAQRAANQRRLEREQERKAQAAAKKPTGPPPPGQPQAAAVVDPRTGLTIPAPGPNRPGDPVGRGANLAAQGKSDGRPKEPAGPAKGLSEAANKIAGLASGIMETRAAERKALADPALYGVSDKRIKDRITAQKNAIQEAKNAKLKQSGGVVYYGSKKEQIRRPQQGGEFEGGTNRIPQSVDVDDVRTKDQLMTWLADETVFNQIKKRMQQSGLDVQSYDDVAKLWKSVVDQAAATYTAGKKVTPWALISLRGKQMVGGKPANKTTTSTSVEEMDPAQARLMVERSASELLGRAPTSAELEDFIAKAQTIARANPNVTKTTTEYDFAGDPVGQSSISSGGADVVSAQAQVAATDAAKQDEEYGAYQAAGVYMPWLMDALASPF